MIHFFYYSLNSRCPFLSGLIFFVVVHRDVVYEELTYDDNACSDYNIVT